MEQKTAEMPHRLLWIIPLVCICLAANAGQVTDNNPEQALTVSGSRPKAGDMISGIIRVQDGPLRYANITERDSLQRIVAHAAADEQGRFSFILKNPDDRIEFSYVGLNSCSLEITGTEYEVILQENVLDGQPLIVDLEKTEAHSSIYAAGPKPLKGSVMDIRIYENGRTCKKPCTVSEVAPDGTVVMQTVVKDGNAHFLLKDPGNRISVSNGSEELSMELGGNTIYANFIPAQK